MLFIGVDGIGGLVGIGMGSMSFCMLGLGDDDGLEGWKDYR